MARQLRKQMTYIRPEFQALFFTFFCWISSIDIHFLFLPRLLFLKAEAFSRLWVRSAGVSPCWRCPLPICRMSFWGQNVLEARPLNLLSKGPKSSVHSSWVILSKWWVILSRWWVNIVWERFSFIKIQSVNFARLQYHLIQLFEVLTTRHFFGTWTTRIVRG